MPWLSEAMKDVTSCDKFRGGANIPWSEDFPMRQLMALKAPYPAVKREANPENWNILVPGGKENNSDSLSSGERTGKSLNYSCFGNYGVIGLAYDVQFQVEVSGKLLHRRW